MYLYLLLTFLFSGDHSRVILKVPDENGSDYINASYIEVGRMMYSMLFTYTLNCNAVILNIMLIVGI